MAVPFGSDRHSEPVTITIHPHDRALVAEAMSDAAKRQDSEGHIRRRHPSMLRAYENSAERLRRLAAQIGAVPDQDQYGHGTAPRSAREFVKPLRLTSPNPRGYGPMTHRAGTDNAKHLRERAEYFRTLARYITDPKMVETIADLVAEYGTTSDRIESNDRDKKS